jgi:hypothetical protein
MFDVQNVMPHNSLQVQNAGRYVFSRVQDFSLARALVESNPEARAGPRCTTGLYGG